MERRQLATVWLLQRATSTTSPPATLPPPSGHHHHLTTTSPPPRLITSGFQLWILELHRLRGRRRSLRHHGVRARTLRRLDVQQHHLVPVRAASTRWFPEPQHDHVSNTICYDLVTKFIIFIISPSRTVKQATPCHHYRHHLNHHHHHLVTRFSMRPTPTVGTLRAVRMCRCAALCSTTFQRQARTT